MDVFSCFYNKNFIKSYFMLIRNTGFFKNETISSFKKCISNLTYFHIMTLCRLTKDRINFIFIVHSRLTLYTCILINSFNVKEYFILKSAI